MPALHQRSQHLQRRFAITCREPPEHPNVSATSSVVSAGDSLSSRKGACSMSRLRGVSRGGRILLALAVGGAVFGIATAVQADIPDNGVIHGCYGKAGT